MSTTTPRLPAALEMGPVGVTVADLDRSARFYAQAIGLGVLERSSSEAVMGSGDLPLVHLVERPGALPAPGRTGLFHLAIRVPERRDLALWLRHVADLRVPLQGLGDHFVSEAIYLADPDQHGIEVYWDRPRDLWEGQVERMGTESVDVAGLLAELGSGDASFGGLPAGSVMGHVHLAVADIAATLPFYRDVLGFDLMTALGQHAVFLAAGGYHHHIGANVWNTRGADGPPEGAAALRYATIRFPDAASRDAAAARVADRGGDVVAGDSGLTVRDPAGIALRLSV